MKDLKNPIFACDFGMSKAIQKCSFRTHSTFGENNKGILKFGQNKGGENESKTSQMVKGVKFDKKVS